MDDLAFRDGACSLFVFFQVVEIADPICNKTGFTIRIFDDGSILLKCNFIPFVGDFATEIRLFLSSGTYRVSFSVTVLFAVANFTSPLTVTRAALLFAKVTLLRVSSMPMKAYLSLHR